MELIYGMLFLGLVFVVVNAYRTHKTLPEHEQRITRNAERIVGTQDEKGLLARVSAIEVALDRIEKDLPALKNKGGVVNVGGTTVQNQSAVEKQNIAENINEGKQS